MVETPTFQLLVCIEMRDGCAQTLEIPFGLDLDAWTGVLHDHNWIASVMSPPGAGKAVMAPLCLACAEKVYPPDLLVEAKRMLREHAQKRPA